MHISGMLLILATLFLPILAEYPFDVPVLTTITSGTTTQVLVLQTQTITSCPCNGSETTATGAAVMSMSIFAESSGAGTVRPGIILGVVGVMGVLGGMGVFP